MHPLKHIEALGSQVMRMQQRQPAVHYDFGALWAADKLVREKLRKLDDVHSVFVGDGFVLVTFKDLRQVRGATIWEALE